jgi:uncharacterized OsmC-like protein
METQNIKTAIQRTKKALTLKPVLGIGTGKSKVRMTNGLRCEIQEGEWKLSADMPATVGGDGSAPTPGVLGRAALGSCLAIGYMMKAAELEIPITGLEVEVEADYDDGALFGTAAKDVPPGYLQIRYTVTVETDAPEDDVMQIVEDGDSHSPYLDIFTRAQKCIRTVNIIPSKL